MLIWLRWLGKSSLTVQFVDGHFVESYYPTIENTFSKVIKYKGQEYATEIVDTAGQVRYFPFLFGVKSFFERKKSVRLTGFLA
jgi:GTPase SAR1 family protein